MKKYLLILFICIGCCGYSQDAYQYVTTGVDHVKYYVKLESVDKGNQEVRVSLKGIIPQAKVKDSHGNTIVNEELSEVSSMVFHMNDRTYDSLDYVAYNSSGELLESGNHFDVAQTIYPNSLLEEIFNNVNSTRLY